MTPPATRECPQKNSVPRKRVRSPLWTKSCIRPCYLQELGFLQFFPAKFFNFIPLYTRVYPCIPVYTRVYPYIPVYSVYPCKPVYTRV